MAQNADIRIEDHGTIMLVRPISEAGEEWLASELSHAQFHGNAAACERRFIGNIVYGIQSDGLIIEGLEPDDDE